MRTSALGVYSQYTETDKFRQTQIRAEVYNLFDQIEFQDIDRTARFDAAGAQINANFGTAIGIASPTRPPRLLQLSVRLTF